MSARDDYPKLHFASFGPRHLGQTSTEAQRALDEIDRLRIERDLAIAHDRQPYPTASAYELACEALRTAKEKIEKLERWKTEALEVLSHWDAVAERFDLSGHLGEFTADGVLQEIIRLQEEVALLRSDVSKLLAKLATTDTTWP